MVLLKFITIAANHLAYPCVSSNKFSCTEPDRDVESSSQLTEAATLWNETEMNFITGFSYERNNFRHRLEVDPCWLDHMNGIPNAQQKAERATQKRQQKQRYMDYSPRGLEPNYLEIKAQEQLLECLNPTRNNFSTYNIQEDVMLQVCSNFLHDVEQIKIELATMRQELRNLRTELQEHRVNCLKRIFKPWAPTQKGEQKTIRFCYYCRKNGHTANWCRQKTRDEEIRKLQRDMSFKNNITPIREYGTSDSNCSREHNQNVDLCPDSDDANIPINKLRTTEVGTCKAESNDVTPLEPKFISTTNGMIFNMARFSSFGESDDELSDPLPLGY